MEKSKIVRTNLTVVKGSKMIKYLFDGKDAVICLDAQLPEDRLVDGPGQAVAELFADQGVMLHRDSSLRKSATFSTPLVQQNMSTGCTFSKR